MAVMAKRPQFVALHRIVLNLCGRVTVVAGPRQKYIVSVATSLFLLSIPSVQHRANVPVHLIPVYTGGDCELKPSNEPAR